MQIQRNTIQQVGGQDSQSAALAAALADLNSQRQQTQQQGNTSGDLGAQMLKGYEQFGMKTDPYGFGGADPFSTSSYAGGEGAVTGAGEAGGGFGEMASSAGPWLALAAVIAGNENEANADGARQDDPWKYTQDLLGGKVLEQDFNQRFLPQGFGEDLQNDDYGFGHDLAALGEFSSGDLGNALKAFKGGTLGKLWGRIT